MDSEQVWRAIDVLDARPALNEHSSYYLLERFVAGEVFHVDSLVEGSEVVFAGVNRYGRPPMDVAHGGGVYISYTIEHDCDDQKQLFEINRKLIKSLGLVRGAAHAEFIKSAADGQFYFLEIAARVGGSYIAEVLEAASGINIWREWAGIELARGERPLELKHDAQGIRRHRALAGATGIARHQRLHGCGDRLSREEASSRRPRRALAKPERVKELLDEYAARFTEEFSAIVPPLERPD